MGEWLLSRRDSMIVARHQVPGKRPPKEPSRRVRSERALLIPEVFLIERRSGIDVRCDGPLSCTRRFLLFSHPKLLHSDAAIAESKCAHLQESDRTLRDGSLGAAIPRHFVPGYDRTVPLGQKLFAHGKPH
jgi:hypothetical protein